MKEQIIFDPNEVLETQDTVGSYLLKADGTPFGNTGNSLDVNITGSTGSIEVTATDLDIRDLSASQDNVAISDGSDTLEINADGSINVNATSVGPIRFINSSSAVVAVEEDVAPLPVKLQSLSGDINVTAGDLNVQLDHIGATFDSVRIGDGTETVAISSNGDMEVVDRANAMQISTAVLGTSFAQVLVSPLAERKKVRIQNRSKKDMEIADSGAASDGYVLPARGAIELELGPGVNIFMKADAASQDVRFIELA
jgi:hypothetical protein